MKAQKTKQEWEEILKSWKISGKSQRIFCAARKIPLSSFNYWRKKQDKGKSEDGLVKISNPLISHSAPESIHIKSSFCSISISGSASEEILTALFRSLKAASS